MYINENGSKTQISTPSEQVKSRENYTTTSVPTTVIIGIAVFIVLILIGVGIYLFNKNNSPNVNTV